MLASLCIKTPFPIKPHRFPFPQEDKQCWMYLLSQAFYHSSLAGILHHCLLWTYGALQLLLCREVTQQISALKKQNVTC